MAESHGGPRTPRNPAPVSGPGKMSRRTDGQVQVPMTGMAYGENSDFNDMQSSAPMKASAPMARPSQGAMPRGPQGTPLFSPTGRPDEPVTAGASVGPGDTPRPPAPPGQAFQTDARALAPFLPSLLRSADQADAPEGFVRFVRALRNMQGGA